MRAPESRGHRIAFPMHHNRVQLVAPHVAAEDLKFGQLRIVR